MMKEKMILIITLFIVGDVISMFLLQTKTIWKYDYKLNKKTYLIYSMAIVIASIFMAYHCVQKVPNTIDIVKLMIVYWVLCAITVIDYTVYLIPNIYVFIIAGGRIVLYFVEYFVNREDFKGLLISGGISLFIIFVLVFLISVLSRGGLGMGDVKLLSAMAFMCGAYTVINTLLIGLFICVVYSMILILEKKKKMKDKIPFGPFIFLGYIVAVSIGAV